VSGKLNADWDFLCFLHEKGRSEAGARLAKNYDTIGQRSSIDICYEFL
jgi:NTE family protein